MHLTVIVLTLNEASNLSDCIQSLRSCTTEIFVLDSGSTDQTVEIARNYGAQVVTHSFHTHATQWKWALQNLPITSDWILGLDADQRLTPELKEEITQILETDPPVAGCYLKRRQIFRGQWIRFGGYYPKYLLKLFRKSQASSDESDLVDHHFRVNGKTLNLKHDMIEDNKKEADLFFFITKHAKYANLQAQQEYEHQTTSSIEANFFGSPDQRVQRLKVIWQQLPIFVRPFLYFWYRYLFRLGFLDGSNGFLFHCLQAFWYRMLVDIRLSELKNLRQTSTLGIISREGL